MPFRRAALPLLVLCVAWPAAAQDGTGARVSPTRPDVTRSPIPRSPMPRAPLAEGAQDPVGLLRLAEGTLAARRLGDTAELLERAEARLLTRSELASAADRPAAGGVIGELAAARSALARRDTAAAQELIASAIRRIEAEAQAAATPAPPTTAVPGPLPAPASGSPPGAVVAPPTVIGPPRIAPPVAGAELPKTPLAPQALPVIKPPAL